MPAAHGTHAHMALVEWNAITTGFPVGSGTGAHAHMALVEWNAIPHVTAALRWKS